MTFASPVVSKPSSPADESPGLRPDDFDAETFDRLLIAYLAERRHLRALGLEMDAAIERLPVWAAIGSAYLLFDGTKGGHFVGWPEVAELPPPSDHPGVRCLIRPSPAEVWQYHTALVPKTTTGALPPAFAEHRRRVRLAAFGVVRRVIARIREARAEMERVGLPAIERRIEASSDRLWDMEQGMLAVVADSAAPAAFAVVALVNALHDEEEAWFAVLRRAAPRLAGLLRDLVDDVLSRGVDGLDDTMLATGELPA